MKNRTTKSGHEYYTNVHCTFLRFFSLKIFNPPKLLNATVDDVKISNKLTSVSPIFPLFKPKYLCISPCCRGRSLSEPSRKVRIYNID